jgi:type VI secretion system secreted protein Hcp
MAVDMFLKLATIKGESKDSKHKEEMDVLAWSWGMSQSGSTHSGTGGGSGKVSVQDISVTKYVDKASPNLLKYCCNGKHFADAVLTVRKAGENPVEYIKITMKEILISAVSTGGSGGEDKLTENVTLNFADFKFEYTPQKDDGSADSAIEALWNIPANAEKA